MEITDMANTNAKRRKKQGKQRRKVSMLKARDETRRMSAAAANASASTARAATDLMRGQFETVQRAWEVAAEAARNVAARPIDQLSRASGLVGKNGDLGMQQSLRNVETVMESGTAFASAIHNISREVVELTSNRLQQNMNVIDALTKCRSPEEFVRTQSEFVRQQIGDYVQSTRRIAEISLDMADQAADKASRSVGQR
jgi:Phasin protein